MSSHLYTGLGAWLWGFVGGWIDVEGGGEGMPAHVPSTVSCPSILRTRTTTLTPTTSPSRSSSVGAAGGGRAAAAGASGMGSVMLDPERRLAKTGLLQRPRRWARWTKGRDAMQARPHDGALACGGSVCGWVWAVAGVEGAWMGNNDHGRRREDAHPWDGGRAMAGQPPSICCGRDGTTLGCAPTQRTAHQHRPRAAAAGDKAMRPR